MKSIGQTTSSSRLLARHQGRGAHGRETSGRGRSTRAHGLTSCRQSAREQLRARQIARLTLGPNVIPGEVDGRQPPPRETSEEVCTEAGHGPLGTVSQGALSSVVLDQVVRLRKCQADVVPPSTWCRTRRIPRTRGEVLLQLLIPTTTPVGAQAALRTEASNHTVGAMSRQVGEAAEEEMVPGTATPGSVDGVAKEKERKEEDEGGGQEADLPMTMIGQRTTIGPRTTTSSPTAAEVVVVLVPETPCWRFSRG